MNLAWALHGNLNLIIQLKIIKLFLNIILNKRISNVNQHVPEELRKKCYNEWNTTSTCAKKDLGDSYVLKLELSRMLPDNDNSEENVLAKYVQMTNDRMGMIKKNFPSEEAEE